MDNLTIIKDFVNKHRGELVLDTFDVVMLEGFEDVPDEDYYWIVTGEKGTYWTSCVSVLYPLKNVLPEEQYNRMLEIYNLNASRWKELAEVSRKQEQINHQVSNWELKWYGGKA